MLITWAVLLNVIALTQEVRTLADETVSGYSVTGVESELVALNTTALQLRWTTNQTKDAVSIDYFQVIVDNGDSNDTEIKICYRNDTHHYDYDITGLEPGYYYNVTLEVYYHHKNDLTTELTTVPMTTTGVNSTSTDDSLYQGDVSCDVLNDTTFQFDESFYFRNNTYPEIPVNISLQERDEHSLTFTWYQEGAADGCSMWTEEDTTETESSCSYDDHQAIGTISHLRLAGENYTISIITTSGSLNSSQAIVVHERTFPSAPDNVTCTWSNTTSLAINITSSPETHVTDSYLIVYSSLEENDEQNMTEENAEGSSTIVSFDSLTPGALYYIQVFAQTADLDSRNSINASCKTVIPYPANVYLKPIDTSTLLVTWEIPFDEYRKTLLGFNVSSENELHYVKEEENRTAYNYTVTDLPVAGKLYLIGVSAFYEDMENSPYIESEQNTNPETPTEIQLTWRTVDQLVFAWRQEGAADGCFMWTETASDGSSFNCSYGDGSARGTIGNLPVAGGNYTVYIVAVSYGLNSSEPGVSFNKTLPPQPQPPQCGLKTNTSLTFHIPAPQADGTYELDGYDVIFESLVATFPNVSDSSFYVLEEVSNVTVDDLIAGVTYNITVTSILEDLKSEAASSASCSTELNSPLGTTILEISETEIQVQWEAPGGYFEGFRVLCLGRNGARNVSADEDIDDPWLNATCNDVTGGALYDISVISILHDSTSKPSPSLLNATVPYSPKTINPSNSTHYSLEIAVTYGYSTGESQCTDYSVSLENETAVFPFTADTTYRHFHSLNADTLFDLTVVAISNYTDVDQQLLRFSENITTGFAWTLAPPVTEISNLIISPQSLYVKFDQVEPLGNVWRYIINVNDEENDRVQTIEMTCLGANQLANSTINCDPNDATSWVNINCSGDSNCIPFMIHHQDFREDIQGRSTNGSLESHSIEKENPKSICYNITDLDPYISYSISVQAVNPGGCSLKETVVFTTSESTPGCVAITAHNESVDSIYLEWTPPDPPNGILTRFLLYYNTTSDNPGNKNVSANVTFTSIDSLNAFADYWIAIVAETSVGIGGFINCDRSTVTVITLIGKPFEPILNAFGISSNSINISWSLEEERRTGPETYYNLTITDTQNSSFIIQEHVPGFDNRSLVVGGLDEYWNYTVDIVAYTVNENEEELTTEGNPKYCRTLESSPGPVADLTVKSLSTEQRCYEAEVTWLAPIDRDLNGVITGYTIRWAQTDGSQEKSVETDANYRSIVLSVEPNDEAYDFRIEAKTSKGPGTSVSFPLGSTGRCRPDPVNETSIFMEPTDGPDSSDSFTVVYDDSFFTDNPNGPVVAQAIMVAEDGDSLNDGEVFGNHYDLFNGSMTWSEAIKEKPIPEYRSTTDDWNPDSAGRQKRDLVSFVVGDDNKCSKGDSSHCNGPLPADRKFRVRGLICTQMDGCYKTKFVFYIYVTKGNDSDDALIAAIVVPLLLLLIAAIVLFAFYYIRVRNRDKDDSRPSERRPNHDIPMSPIPYAEHFKSGAKTIRIADFAAHVVQMHRNSDLDFSDEYQEIQNNSAKHSWNSAERQENKNKNRFVNILPFDHSRVKLREIDDGECSDYINANNIPDRIRQTEFIACQGPLLNTIDAFWQMIWEQQTKVIVMLTNVMEKGREKCARYWPDGESEEELCWHVRVFLISESPKKDYVIRRIKLSRLSDSREVVHYQFTSWPDFGVPSDPNTVLEFVEMVRKQAGNHVHPPMTVHCSAGVGRTGTFIAIDRLLREIFTERQDAINIFDLVLQLRHNRCLMVQTESQYIFIHDCLTRAIQRYSFDNRSFDNSFDDEPIYQNQIDLSVDEKYVH